MVNKYYFLCNCGCKRQQYFTSNPIFRVCALLFLLVSSLKNLEECQLLLEVVTILLNRGILPSRLGVITPYRSQESLIKKSLLERWETGRGEGAAIDNNYKFISTAFIFPNPGFKGLLKLALWMDFRFKKYLSWIPIRSSTFFFALPGKRKGCNNPVHCESKQFFGIYWVCF